MNDFLRLINDPESRRHDQILCVNRDVKYTWEDLLHKQQMLMPQITSADDYVVLYNDDGFEFLSGLFALWGLGKVAVIPSNNLESTVSQLKASYQYFFEIIDRGTTVQTDDFSITRRIRHLDDLAVVIFTSGSSGAPEAIEKTFRQLINELNTLESCWGKYLDSCEPPGIIASTVSHHHIYGLLFKILWPVMSGRPFVPHTREYFEDVIADANYSTVAAIVSSPAHLSRLPQANWQPVRSNVQMIFSSGSPLNDSSAAAAFKLLGRQVMEVYGSSETGGIAWRQQLLNDRWTPFSGVKLKVLVDSPQQDSAFEEGRLSLKSLNLANEKWFDTEDICRLYTSADDIQFSLRGRADRIVKIAGKRISLARIEFELLQHDWVAEVKPLVRPNTPDRISVVIKLSPTGNDVLVDQGKRPVVKALRQFMDNKIERVAIPRYWRFVSAFPQNNQSKVTALALNNLFDDKTGSTLPEMISKTLDSENSCSLELRFNHDFECFKGHFPGQPILPGVVQINLAIHFAREIFGGLGEFSAMEALKFQQVVVPGQLVSLQLDYKKDKNKLVFSYCSTDKQYSSGRICFQNVEADNA